MRPHKQGNEAHPTSSDIEERHQQRLQNLDNVSKIVVVVRADANCVYEGENSLVISAPTAEIQVGSLKLNWRLDSGLPEEKHEAGFRLQQQHKAVWTINTNQSGVYFVLSKKENGHLHIQETNEITIRDVGRLVRNGDLPSGLWRPLYQVESSQRDPDTQIVPSVTQLQENSSFLVR